MKLSIAAAAAEVPDGLALIAAGLPFTFAELAAEVERAEASAALRHRAGISDDILGVEAPPWRGARREHTGAYVTDEQRSQGERIGGQMSPGISARCLSPAIDLPSVRAILAALERHAPLILRHPGRPGPAPAAPSLAASDALAIETSGSTATPRLVRLGRAALIAHSEASAARLGWRADDRWLIALPLAHVGGLAPLLRCLIGRKAAILLPRFTVAAFADAARRHRATLTSLVPAMLAALLDDGWRPPETLRAVLVGGAAATPSLLARARDRGVPVVTAYGLTETFSHIALDGALLPGVEAKSGEAGVLWVRGPMLFSGYAGEQARAPGDWHPTGDLGEIDGEGRLQIRGRADEVIVTGGENVSPAAVERAIAELFPGAEVCVFGLPDARWGEIVCAALANPGSCFDREALARSLAARLAGFEIPRLTFVLPALPRLPSGKIDRRAVAAGAASE